MSHPYVDNACAHNTLCDRLLAVLDTSAGPDGCWPFVGKPNDAGYGRLRFEGRLLYIHRIALELASGIALIEGEMVDHICHDPRECFERDACPHRRCGNPAHLRRSTHAENASAARSVGGRRGPDEICKRGHLVLGDNRWVRSTHGGAACRECHRVRARELRARTRAARLAETAV